MKSSKKINLYCVDNDIRELEYFRENFRPNMSFNLLTYSSVHTFLVKLKEDVRENSNVKIVIIDNIITSRGYDTKTALEILPFIKNIDKEVEIIIFADSENIELKATTSVIRPAAFIEKDSQYFVRLYPLISRIISEYEVKKKKRRLKVVFGYLIFFLIVLFAFLILGFLINA